jgi:hypothetical protein
MAKWIWLWLRKMASHVRAGSCSNEPANPVSYVCIVTEIITAYTSGRWLLANSQFKWTKSGAPKNTPKYGRREKKWNLFSLLPTLLSRYPKF